MHADLWFDGACRGNPGPGGAGAFVRKDGEAGGIRLHRPLDFCTNNEAEFLGLILGLEWAIQEGITSITIFGDSKLVVEVAAGRWNLQKDTLLPYKPRIARLLERFEHFSIQWIPREVNTEADAASRGLRAVRRDIKGSKKLVALKKDGPDRAWYIAQRKKRIAKMRRLGYEDVR